MATLEDVLQAENEQIQISREQRLEIGTAADGFIGLAFSGGGIRSATFNLGLLQSFASNRLLRYFDYLSTVSGGGYIGAWLMAWMRNKKCGIAEAELEFGVKAYEQFADNERHPVRFLRYYSRYLSPKLGFLSADLWTLLSTYLRNTVLNFSILSSVITVLLLLPRWIAAACFWLTKDKFVLNIPGFGALPFVALGVAAILVLVSTALIGLNLANVPFRHEEVIGTYPKYTSQRAVQLLCVLTVFAACVVLSTALHRALEYNAQHFGTGYLTSATSFSFAAKLWLVGSLPYGIVSALASVAAILLIRITKVHVGSNQMLVFKLIGELAGWGIGSCMLTGSLLIFVQQLFSEIRSRPEGEWLIVGLGTSLIVVNLQITSIFQIGFMGRRLPDEMREWWSRFMAWTSIYNFIWIVCFMFVIYVPEIIRNLAAFWPRVLWLTVLGWVVVTMSGVLAAKSSSTGAARFAENVAAGLLRTLKRIAASCLAISAPYIFIVGILALFAFAIGSLPTLHKEGTLLPAANGALGVMLLLTTGCVIVAGFLGWRVDVNEFSMHSLYRNRLVRCYLGASALNRNPQPFTAFDPADDVPLSQLRSKRNHPGWPYLILNATLNVVRGPDALGLQNRKGKSFVFTPLYCGYDTSKPSQPTSTFAATEKGGGKPSGGPKRALAMAAAAGAGIAAAPARAPIPHPEEIALPVPKEKTCQITGFAPSALAGCQFTSSKRRIYRGLRLGTAMAISGAAASPNMGYHTSPATAFLLSLFNIRLGWWLGNPRFPVAWVKGSPRFGLFWLLSELFGSTSDSKDYLYLSDGGHFENLGIYELVRRKCRLIVVSDAGADPEYRFTDLANAIERCRTDFAVEIRVEKLQDIRPVDKSSKPFAIGEIDYGAGEKGVLIYIKPTLLGELPQDVREYANGHFSPNTNKFPQQSTMNQFFSESQFEAYRALGTRTGDEVAKVIQNELQRLIS